MSFLSDMNDYFTFSRRLEKSEFIQIQYNCL